MARPPLPPGTYGKIKAWQEGGTWLARVKFRDFDGIVRLVKRSGKTRAAAERALRAALVDRQTPVAQAEITAETKVAKVAELWLAEIERAVDAGTKSPGTLDAYRSIYRRHVKPALGSLRVREVDTPAVDRFLMAIKLKTVSGARTAKIVISGMMHLAARHGAVTANPVREVARIEATAPSTKTGTSGERLIPLPSWAVTMLKSRRLAIASDIQPVFPDSLGGWRDPSNVRRVWRRVRDDAGIEGLVSHTLRKTVASFLDDAAVPTRKISDQLGHSKVSMTQDHYLGRKLTDRQTADVLEKLMGSSPA